MLHGLGSSASSSTQSLASLFKKLDTNADNSVDRTEFVAGRPDDVSEDQAGSLFDTLDSSGTGSLGQTDFTSAFQQMSAGMHSVLLQAQESQQNGQGGPGGPPDPQKMFEDLDADGDGTVTRDEFVSGRPSGASEDQAGAFYDKIASAAGADGTSGLTQDQLASGLKAAGPPDGQSTADASGTSSVDDQMINQLLSLLLSQTSGTTAAQQGQAPDSSKMFEDLDSDGDGTVTRSEFVAGRPDAVGEDQAGDFYDKIASASGADGSSGLTQDQLASGLQKAGPPPPPPGGPGATDSAQSTSDSDSDSQTASLQGSTTDQLLQELLKAIGSYQKANLQSVSNTNLAA
jgi:Ca2+-binding EF-hand superfamily protein